MCICCGRCWSGSFVRRIVAVAIVATVFGSHAAKSDALDLARAGLAAKDRREFTLATRLFDAALREGNFADKDRGLLIYSRGVSYEALGMYDKAMADLDAAIVLLPDFPNAYIYRGLVWAEVGMYDRAIADNVYAARLKPNDPMIYNNLGGVYEKKGDWDKAIENYDRAIQLRPDYAEAYYNRARAYIGKQDEERALADYDQAIWLQPDLADAYGNRAILHLVRGRTDQAFSDLSSAIKLKPRDLIFWTNRANAYLTVEKYGDALSDFDQAQRIDPGNMGIYLGRGRARLFGGDIAGSIDDFKTAVRLRPSNPYAVIWLHIARVHLGDQDQEELAADAKNVIRDVWPRALVDYYLGVSDAERVRSAAQGGPPQEKAKRTCEAEFHIGEFEAHNGDPGEARKLLEAVVAKCRPYDVVYSSARAELNFVQR